MGSYLSAIEEDKKKKAEDMAAAKEEQAKMDTPYQDVMLQSVTQEPTAIGGTSTVSGNAEEAKPENVTYIDENGEKQTGYVEAAKNAETAAKLSRTEQMEKFYNEQYERAVAANNAAAAAQAARALAQIEKQKADLQANNDALNKQLYRDYREAKKNLPQELAANGYTGGMSDSARIQLQNSYEEQLGENERSLRRSYSDLDAAAVDAQYQADAAAQAANAEAEDRRASYIAALKDQEASDALDKAMNYGNATGDFSELVKLGYYTEEEAAALQKAWIASNPKLAEAMGYVKASKKSGGGGTPLWKLLGFASQEEYEAALAELEAEETAGSGETDAGNSDTGGTENTGAPMTESTLNTALRIRDSGGKDMANSYVNEMRKAGAMTTAEANSIKKILNGYKKPDEF